MDGAALGLAAARLLVVLRPDEIEAGLTPEELVTIERRRGFVFAEDHRAFLAAGLPTGVRWPDWRGGVALHEQLAWPVSGVLFDVEHNAFWYPGWGRRPDPVADAVALAAHRLRGAPLMVPVYGHRYLPAGPGPGGHPVLSMQQSDVIVYGTDLLDYLGREFSAQRSLVGHDSPHATVEFWRDLVG